MEEEKFNTNIDLANVEPQDLSCVKQIVRAVLRFQEEMPRVTVRVAAPQNSNAYNVLVGAWNAFVDDARWFEEFLQTKSGARAQPGRDARYDPILGSQTMVVEEAREGPIKRVFVRKNAVNEAIAQLPLRSAGVGRVDLTKIERRDRAYVRVLLDGIFGFEEPEPDFHVDVLAPPHDDHYVLTIKGWSQPMDDRLWYDTFLRPRKSQDVRGRAPQYDRVLSTQCTPLIMGDGEEGRDVMPSRIIKIEKTVFSRARAPREEPAEEPAYRRSKSRARRSKSRRKY